MQENFVIHPAYAAKAEDLRAFLNNFATQGEYVVEGARNIIKKVVLGNEVFNVKQFKSPSIGQALVYRFFRKSKAKRSFEYAERLLKCKIATPAPVGYLEIFGVGLKTSFYISKHVDYDFDFRALIHQPKFEHRAEILKQFAGFCFAMHQAGINFLDHSPGNTLVCKTGAQAYSFYLIDLNRMRFEPMDLDARMHNLRRLWLSKTMIRSIAMHYAVLGKHPVSKVEELLLKHSKRFQNKVNLRKLRRRSRAFRNRHS